VMLARQSSDLLRCCAPGGIRTPNRQIRSLSFVRQSPHSPQSRRSAAMIVEQEQQIRDLVP
jgi:hypothetical protein